MVEKIFERLYLQVPTAEGARQVSHDLTKATHVSGTEADYNTAIYVMERWADSLGVKRPENSSDLVFDAGSPQAIDYMTRASKEKLDDVRVWIDTYSIWLNYPKSSSVTLSRKGESKAYFSASLKEDVVEGDEFSGKGLPVFHGYSKSGKASGPIVYANKCTLEDFERLDRLKVSVKGAVTLCRYGGPFRGLKVRMSAEHGAVGTLIYSDPAEDGDITWANHFEPYPFGPARQPSSVQRGSVQALSLYPGDPGTPGVPSYRNASRLNPDTADSLPKIPSLPISYKDAKAILDSLKGKGVSAKEAGDSWTGLVPSAEYWTGPSEDECTLENVMTNISEPRDVWNTYAVIPGLIDDEMVVVSNHRDAWTFGAGDPSSGTAAVHELVKGLGSLVKKGWRPLRTILIASWDAEEYGLVGSTEAAEDYAQWFTKKAAVFLNVDIAASGSQPTSKASPSLSDLIVDAASEVKNPDTEGNITFNHPPGSLGSGSDYTAYLQHLGIASVDMGYTGNRRDAVYHYHSNYDNFHWMDNYGDPGFKRHLAIAQWLGLATLRSAQKLQLPLNTSRYADALGQYYDKVEEEAKKAKVESKLDLNRLRKAIEQVAGSAHDFEERRTKVNVKIKELLGNVTNRKHQRVLKELKRAFAELVRLNKEAKMFEMNFIDENGLRGRPFYRHLGVAPGRYLGYGSTTFPGLTESLTLDRSKGADQELDRLVKALHRIATGLQDGGDKWKSKQE